jgi:hypothetical protein
VHSKYIPIYIQQDTTLRSLFISGNCSTCFGWYFHPSSGTRTPVSTASGICHTVTAICRYRGRVGTCLSVLWVAYATHTTLKPVFLCQMWPINLAFLLFTVQYTSLVLFTVQYTSLLLFTVQYTTLLLDSVYSLLYFHTIGPTALLQHHISDSVGICDLLSEVSYFQYHRHTQLCPSHALPHTIHKHK